jgi:hypothetical protein
MTAAIRRQVDPGQFVELDAEAQRARTNVLRDLVDFMKYGWQLEAPSIILSVMDGATHL